MVGDAVLFKNKEIKPSIDLGGLPEEAGKVIQGVCLFQGCVVINPVTMIMFSILRCAVWRSFTYPILDTAG